MLTGKLIHCSLNRASKNYVSDGDPGAKGENLLIRADGRIIRLPSKAHVTMEPGVSLL